MVVDKSGLSACSVKNELRLILSCEAGAGVPVVTRQVNG